MGPAVASNIGNSRHNLQLTGIRIRCRSTKNKSPPVNPKHASKTNRSRDHYACACLFALTLRLSAPQSYTSNWFYLESRQYLFRSQHASRRSNSDPLLEVTP